MKKVLFLSACTLLAIVVVGGGAAAYIIMGSQDRGMTRDGRIAPPASVRNAPEAPKFDAAKKDLPAKTAEHAPNISFPRISSCRPTWISRHRGFPMALRFPRTGRRPDFCQEFFI